MPLTDSLYSSKKKNYPTLVQQSALHNTYR